MGITTPYSKPSTAPSNADRRCRLWLAVGMMLALLASILALPQPAVASLSEPGTAAIAPAPQQASVDYDTDDDGLIEVSNLAQLDAIRYDLRGNGSPSADDRVAYYAAFPRAAAGMGCPNRVCAGYELTADLDFDTNRNGRADTGDAYYNNGAGWEPIGFEPGSPFTSTFDGGGHAITNLFINREHRDNVGLFGSLHGALIRNVGLVAVNVTGGRDYVGGLVGLAIRGSISDSYTTGSVTGSRHGGFLGNVGGLVGYASSDISGSYATGSVTGNDRVGGLVGSTDHHSASIISSYATGTVTGRGDHVGGLVGYAPGDISGSYATGSVTGRGNVGGLSGSSGDIFRGSISGSYATGSVTGEYSVGGLAGSSGEISGSYATGTVTGSGDLVGGLVGTSFGNISGGYATGSVTGRGSVGGLAGYAPGDISASYATGTVTGNNRVGGLVGISAGSVTGSYWDITTSGQQYSAGGIGKTTRELQSPIGNIGIYANWDPEVWDFGTSSQYPHLKGLGARPAAQPSISTPQPGALGKPTNVVAEGGVNEVTVNWQDGPGATRHQVFLYRSDLTGDPWQATADGNSHTFRDVPAGEYLAVVVAYDADGNQELADSAAVQVTDPPLSSGLTAPTNVAATVSVADVTVTWRDGAGAVGHMVMLFRADFTGSPLVAFATGGSHTFKGVAAGSYIAVAVAFEASGDYRYNASGLVTVAAPSAASIDQPALAPATRLPEASAGSRKTAV